MILLKTGFLFARNWWYVRVYIFNIAIVVGALYKPKKIIKSMLLAMYFIVCAFLYGNLKFL